MYNFKEVEEKWEKRWDEEKSFKAIMTNKGRKYG